MENRVDTYIDGIIKEVPTLVEDKYDRTAISPHRQLTKIVLEFVAKYDTKKGECHVLLNLLSDDSPENENPITQISSALISQLKKIKITLKQDFVSLELDAAPSDLIKNLSYKVWLKGKYHNRYEASLI